jgi:prolycopene isomerase
MYDVIIAGAGIGGLTAGALLAHAGMKALVVEAESDPGGYAHTFRVQNYAFDRADHLIMACDEAGPFGPGIVDAVLRHLGVRDRVRFIRMDDPVYVGRFPDLTVSVPHGREAYLDSHLRHFPREAAGLRHLASLSTKILRELLAFPLEPRRRDLIRLPRQFPNVFRYRNATIRDVIDRELTDPRLREVYATLSTWIGPPIDRASFVLWAGMMASYIEDGAYYCVGGFQALVDAIRAGLTQAGGELLLGHSIERILVEGRAVRGVELDDGHRIEASTVVSNVDARQTFEDLLGSEPVSARYRHRLRTMSVSPSALAIYAATDLDVRGLGAAHDTTLFTRWNQERTVHAAPAWEGRGFSVLIPTLKDASLAPPGQHLVILKAFGPSTGDLPPAGDEVADRMLELAEQVLPGLRRHLTFVYERAARATFSERLHLLGPVYGWAATPDQTGPRRLSQVGPIPGLFLVGHWTRPGHGIATVVRSGVGAARLVLGSSASTPDLPLGL